MKLIVGLGNPGKKYERSWHNLGFAVLDLLRKELNLTDFKKSVKFKGEITKGEVGNETIILLKPTTFMNNSGLAVAALSSYFKIKPKDIIIIHDDLDLPLGKLRLATNSSAGGHNGLKSIIEQLGSKEFYRIKIGIKTELVDKINPADYVLTGWDKEQSIAVKEQLKKAAEAANDLLAIGPAKAMNKWN
jgi:peptidyl-tRNA hydrolase, PTH1 family